MGRRKIEMKKIEDKSSRQVTFSKRRMGLVKKARELSILCDVDVAVLVFSNRGRLYEFVNSSSPSTNLSQILKRYQDSTAVDGKASMIVDETENGLVSPVKVPDEAGPLVTGFLGDIETVTGWQWYLEGPEIENLGLDDFTRLERQLADALVQTRAQKALLYLIECHELNSQDRTALSLFGEAKIQTQRMLESMGKLREQEKRLEQENEQLKDEVSKLIGNSKSVNPTGLGFNDMLEDAHIRCSQPLRTLPLLR